MIVQKIALFFSLLYVVFGHAQYFTYNKTEIIGVYDESKRIDLNKTHKTNTKGTVKISDSLIIVNHSNLPQFEIPVKLIWKGKNASQFIGIDILNDIYEYKYTLTKNRHGDRHYYSLVVETKNKFLGTVDWLVYFLEPPN